VLPSARPSVPDDEQQPASRDEPSAASQDDPAQDT
jgi:hypothetical protein